MDIFAGAHTNSKQKNSGQGYNPLPTALEKRAGYHPGAETAHLVRLYWTP
jgi:hypothetical protein